MILLLLKLTAFLLAGLAALAVTKNASAARRHLFCAGTLAGSLLMPVASLLAPANSQFTIKAFAGPAARAFTNGQGTGMQWILAIEFGWAAGTALLLIRLVIAHVRLSSIAQVEVPVAAGLFRPAILLPRDFETWPKERQSAVLRHERAHIERNDLWVNLLGNVVCAVYWFHPLVWILNAYLRDEQEAACDDAVLAAGFDRASYAEALLAVARTAGGASLAGCAMTSKMNLRTRIARLLSEDSIKASRLRVAAVCVTMLLAFSALAPVRAQTVYRVGGDVTAPRILSKFEPQYSEEARAAGVQGTVTLTCVVRPDGMAHEINVTRGVGYGLDEQAIQALTKWHFEPAKLKGDAVAVSVTIEVNFRLQ